MKQREVIKKAYEKKLGNVGKTTFINMYLYDNMQDALQLTF